jgi:hypothetical protein
MNSRYSAIPRSQVERAVLMIAEISKIPVEVLLNRRDPLAAKWRFVAMALFRRAGYSYPQIGAAFGRDHTSVLGGTKKIEATESTVVDEVARRVNIPSIKFEGPSSSMADALAETRLPEADLATHWRQSLGDAIGAALNAAGGVYQQGDLAAWRRMERMAEKLHAISTVARDGLETRGEQ